MSEREPILAYHVVFGMYGFWLPNDPRGSWSKYVGSDALYRAGGRATKVTGPRSRARDPHDRDTRRTAKQVLSRPPVRFDGRQALAAANGFAELLRRDGLTAFACAVMPDHVHLVLARRGPLAMRMTAERACSRLKSFGSRRLCVEGRHPFKNRPDRRGRLPTPWVDGEWKVYVHSTRAIRHAIRYVENNPVEIDLPRQRWSFVTPCDLF